MQEAASGTTVIADVSAEVRASRVVTSVTVSLTPVSDKTDDTAASVPSASDSSGTSATAVTAISVSACKDNSSVCVNSSLCTSVIVVSSVSGARYSVLVYTGTDFFVCASVALAVVSAAVVCQTFVVVSGSSAYI